MSPKDYSLPEPKSRIFNAAAALFVNKGFEAVGVREIAKEAKVNIAMINYYFGGKVGILKAILDEAYQKYHQAQASAGDDSTPPEQRARNLVTNVVRFFRDNTEIALVTFNTMLFDIPEILSLREKWAQMNFAVMGGFFSQIGVDLKDPVHNSVYNGFLGNMIKSHFQIRYFVDRMPAVVTGENGPENTETNFNDKFSFDDDFYDRYIDLLVHQYFHGVIYATQNDKMKHNRGENK
ncbi:MAG: TetR family transcriptional regulator [bacterium]|nr:TetR family transcriptional regulator [bacterium]